MNISVLGLWRDSEEYAKRTLSQLENLESLSGFNFSFYFYENDSKDSTKDILHEWCKNREGRLLTENRQFPKYGSVTTPTRLILLSFYRNKLKALLPDKDPNKLSLLIDTDIVFTNSHFQDLFNSLISLNATMVVSNTRQLNIPDCIDNTSTDSFYDVFALRDRLNNMGLYFSDCPLVLDHDRELWKNNRPIKINSGFSGFAMIQQEALHKCYWSTCQHSEHVNFCTEVLSLGNIYVIPSCKPYTEIDALAVTQQAYNNVQKQQHQLYSKINQIYHTSRSIDLSLGSDKTNP